MLKAQNVINKWGEVIIIIMNKAMEFNRLKKYLSKCPEIKLLKFVYLSNQINPQDIWCYVASLATPPTLKITLEKYDNLSELWWELTEKINFFSSSEMLLSIGRNNLGSLPWIQIYVGGKTDLIKCFSVIKDEPEFIGLNTEGNKLIGITTEEDAIWLFVAKIKQYSSDKLMFHDTVLNNIIVRDRIRSTCPTG